MRMTCDKSYGNLRSLFTRMEEMAKKVGLQVNEKKTEYMVMGEETAWPLSHT